MGNHDSCKRWGPRRLVAICLLLMGACAVFAVFGRTILNGFEARFYLWRIVNAEPAESLP